ncbi:class I SAM-dependent methyltransferase [Albirhodobacter sp. R86504]|uniref:class I SAM-dependent methyltransferase n=1 Tax=Albirhodobacter sp. R86504 TaxID=3093848 RepID=UPI003670BEDB
MRDPQTPNPIVTKGTRFWNRFAKRYAARPIQDTAAYEALLADVATRLRATDHVLEIGCGTGGTAIRLAPLVASFRATDFSDQMVRIAQAKAAPDNLEFHVTTAQTALEDGPFDAICAFNVLHLVDDLPKLLREIYHALHPGGLLISKTWCFADLGRRPRAIFKVLKFIGLFPPATSLTELRLRQLFEAAGFNITDRRVFGNHSQNPYFIARKPI